MASFLALYSNEYDTINAGDGSDYLSSVNQYKQNIRKWKENPQKFREWVAATAESPVVIALPANGARVAFIYCTAMDDEGFQLLGIKGFSPFNKCSIEPDDMFGNLVSEGVAKRVKELQIPKIKQLFQADSAVALTKLKGEDKQTIASFGKICPVSMLWPGIFLPGMVDGKSTIPANELLFKIIEELKLLRRRVKDDNEEIGPEWWKGVVSMWSDHLRYLWVVAKGGVAAVTMKQSSDRRVSRGFERLLRLKWELAESLGDDTTSSGETIEQTKPSETSANIPRLTPPIQNVETRSTPTTPTQPTLNTMDTPIQGETVARLHPPRPTRDPAQGHTILRQDIELATDETILEGLQRGTQALSPIMEETTLEQSKDDDRKPAAIVTKKRKPPPSSPNAPRSRSTRQTGDDHEAPMEDSGSISVPDNVGIGYDDGSSAEEEGGQDDDTVGDRDEEEQPEPPTQGPSTGRSNAGGGGGGDDDDSDGQTATYQEETMMANWPDSGEQSNDDSISSAKEKSQTEAGSWPRWRSRTNSSNSRRGSRRVRESQRPADGLSPIVD